MQIDTKSVVKELSRLQEESGDELAVVFERNRESSDIFKGILGVERGEKYLSEVTLAMFVDYSLSDEFLEALESGDKEKILSFELK